MELAHTAQDANDLRVVALVAARMSSTRFPGKVVQAILGKPLLERLFERLGRSKKIHQMCLATSAGKEDNVLADLASRLRIDCFRGSRDDVLRRFCEAARQEKADVVVRITGDCPLIDPEIVDEVVTFFLHGHFDYASNHLSDTFPRGLDAEVFLSRILEEANRETTDADEREHVTLRIYRHPERYRIGKLSARGELKRPEIRLCVDEADDLVLVRKIFEGLYHQNRCFAALDIVRFLDRYPELINLNTHVKQKVVA